jgi:hypothetical protein
MEPIYQQIYDFVVNSKIYDFVAHSQFPQVAVSSGVMAVLGGLYFAGKKIKIAITGRQKTSDLEKKIKLLNGIKQNDQ